MLLVSGYFLQRRHRAGRPGRWSLRTRGSRARRARLPGPTFRRQWGLRAKQELREFGERRRVAPLAKSSLDVVQQGLAAFVPERTRAVVQRVVRHAQRPHRDPAPRRGGGVDGKQAQHETRRRLGGRGDDQPQPATGRFIGGAELRLELRSGQPQPRGELFGEGLGQSLRHGNEDDSTVRLRPPQRHRPGRSAPGRALAGSCGSEGASLA